MILHISNIWLRAIRTTLLLLYLTSISLQQNQTNANSKRGLPYPGPPTDPDDYALFFSQNSSIRWYYNWSPNPSSIPSNSIHPIEFLPMIHGNTNLDADTASIYRLSSNTQLPNGSRRKILSFNEPDGATSGGGSNISPQDAAQAYLQYIVPLQQHPYNMLISHPSVTATSYGLDWLRAFNTSCHTLNPDQGCPTDFLSVHHYGDLPSLASWLGTINGFYNADPYLSKNLPIYITEFALVQAPALATEAMLNATLPYLDSLSYVSGYAWFGLFRTSQPNNWTGAGNAMLDSTGALTAIGSEYLGGQAAGFQVGAKGSASMFGAGWDWGVGNGRNGQGGSDGGFGGGNDGSSNALGGDVGGISKAWALILAFLVVWVFVWTL